MMNYTFFKYQILAIALFFLSAPIAYSQALTMPFYEGFELGTTIPTDWTQEVVSGPDWIFVNSGDADAGTNNAVFRSYVAGASGLVTRLVTPELDLSGTDTVVLKFSYYNDGWFDFFSHQDVLTIKYKAAVGDDWTTIQYFNSDVPDWTQVNIVLPNLSDTYYIAVEGSSNGGFGIGVDEITINQGIKITTSTDGGGAIDPSGEVYVPIGSSPRFNLRAYYHSRISELLVDGEPVAEAVDKTLYNYTFPSVDAMHTIAASFIFSESYNVTTEAVPSDAGSVVVSGNLFYGETVTVDAWLSGELYYFSHWTSNGDSISADNPFSFVLTSDTALEANYKLVNPALTLPVYEGFEEASTIPDGWSQELITGPLWTVGNGNSPYPLEAYSGDNNLIFRSDNPDASGIFTRLVTPTLDMTGVTTPVLKFYYVNAEYFNTVAHQDQLTVKYKTAYYDSWTTLATFNTDVTDWTEVSIVLPSPSSGYIIAFEGKSNGGYGISIDDVTINEDDLDGYFITASTVGNGSITPSGEVFVSNGATQEFNVEANYGYHISSLKVDGATIADATDAAEYTYTFESVVATQTIAATFAANALSVTVLVTPSSAGSVSIQGELYYGNTITLWPMTAKKKAVFSFWSSNGVNIGTANPFIFTLVSDTIITAHYKKKGTMRTEFVTREVNENGIENSLIESVKLYPNPANDNLHIDLISDAQVSVFDMQGKLLYAASMTSGSNSINVSEFNSGTYIVKLQFEDEVITKKFVRN
ncbi:MAG: T9SS type A sorting domain-containing protein [Chitinophagales bacterium]